MRRSSKSRCGSAPIGDDVHRRRDVGWHEGLLVDAERYELHPGRRAVRRQPPAQLLDLELAVREHSRRRTERARIEASHALRAQPCEALRKPDRDVDERRPHPPCPVDEHERDPDRVNRRKDHVGTVGAAQRGENRGEVAAVATRVLEHGLRCSAGSARPGRRTLGSNEVVAGRPAALCDLVEAEQDVALGRSGRRGERRPPLGRVPEEVEDGGHGSTPVR